MNYHAIHRTILVSILSFVFAFCLWAAPIHDVAKTGDMGKVRALLVTDPTLIDAKDKEGSTPLMAATIMVRRHKFLGRLAIEETGGTPDRRCHPEGLCYGDPLQSSTNRARRA
ncbi:MAG: hypothetical protein WC378_00500 [Opitutaceae bacterium]|jgi:hypothetical protein